MIIIITSNICNKQNANLVENYSQLIESAESSSTKSPQPQSPNQTFFLTYCFSWLFNDAITIPIQNRLLFIQNKNENPTH